MPLSSTLSTLPQDASAHADTARLCPSNLYLLLPFLPDSFLLLNPQKEWDPPGLEQQSGLCTGSSGSGS